MIADLGSCSKSTETRGLSSCPRMPLSSPSREAALCSVFTSPTLVGRDTSKPQKDSRDRAAPPCERFAVVEPLAAPPCERFAVVEPLAAPLCERFAVVEPLAAPLCERFAVVEPPAAPLCERFAVVRPLAALVEPLAADRGRFRESPHAERDDPQQLSMTRNRELRALPGPFPATQSADGGRKESPGSARVRAAGSGKRARVPNPLSPAP